MTNLERALSRYEEGRLTATGLILASLQLVNAQNVDAVVGSLPSEVAEELRQFAERYHSGIRVFNAPKPSEESIRIIKEWFADHSLLKGNA